MCPTTSLDDSTSDENTRYYQRYIMSGSICCRICYTYPWFRNTNYAANWLVCSSFSRIACFLSFCFPLYQLSPNTPNIPANKARLLKQIPTIWWSISICHRDYFTFFIGSQKTLTRITVNLPRKKLVIAARSIKQAGYNIGCLVRCVFFDKYGRNIATLMEPVCLRVPVVSCKPQCGKIIRPFFTRKCDTRWSWIM